MERVENGRGRAARGRRLLSGIACACALAFVWSCGSDNAPSNNTTTVSTTVPPTTSTVASTTTTTAGPTTTTTTAPGSSTTTTTAPGTSTTTTSTTTSTTTTSTSTTTAPAVTASLSITGQPCALTGSGNGTYPNKIGCTFNGSGSTGATTYSLQIFDSSGTTVIPSANTGSQAGATFSNVWIGCGYTGGGIGQLQAALTVNGSVTTSKQTFNLQVSGFC